MTKHILKDKGEGYKERTTAVKGEEKGGERSRTDKRGDEQIREEQHA